MAKDWEMRVNLRRQLKFAVIKLQPDILLWSWITKQVALIELTVSVEVRIKDAHERKLSKYQSLIFGNQKMERLGPVEVGCKGFPWGCLKSEGQPART